MSGRTDNPKKKLTSKQAKVHRMVKGHPGITIQGVADALGVSHSTAASHLRRLVVLEYVRTVREGQSVHHFSLIKSSRDLLHQVLRNFTEEIRRVKIVQDLIDNHERRTINRISQTVGMDYGYTKRSLEYLAEHDFVNMEKTGTRTYAVATDLLLDTLEETNEQQDQHEQRDQQGHQGHRPVEDP